MALSCNAFGGTEAPLAETISTTQQQVSCIQFCVNTLEIEDDQFYTLVIDALERLAIKLDVTSAQIDELDADELAEAVENARCGLAERQVVPVDFRRSKAVILAQLNELLCAD